MPKLDELKGKLVAKKFADPTSITTTTPGLTRDEWLEGFAVSIRDNLLVLNQLMPEKTVKFDSAKFHVYSKRGYFKGAAKRAETALPEQAALQYTYDNYTCEEFALEGWVSDDAVRNAASDLDPYLDETDFLSKKVLLTQEILIANELFAAVKAGGTDYYTALAAAAKWNGGASSDPLTDLSTAIKAIALQTGRRPNVTAMNTDTYESFVGNEDIIDILKRQSASSITDALPVNAIRGMRILMADGLVNIGTEAVPSYKNILYDTDAAVPLNQTAIVAYVGSDRLSLGTTFVSKNFTVYRGRGTEGDRRQASVVAVWKKFIPKVTNVGAVYVIGKTLG